MISISCSDLLSNPDFAEAVFCFCSETDVFNDFCDRFGILDISLCEYVAYYRFDDFLEWYKANYSIVPSKVVRNGNVLTFRTD